MRKGKVIGGLVGCVTLMLLTTPPCQTEAKYDCRPTLAKPCERVTDDVPTRIEEDDPRWDCRTMGNNICGPVGGWDGTGTVD